MTRISGSRTILLGVRLGVHGIARGSESRRIVDFPRDFGAGARARTSDLLITKAQEASLGTSAAYFPVVYTRSFCPRRPATTTAD